MNVWESPAFTSPAPRINSSGPGSSGVERFQTPLPMLMPRNGDELVVVAVQLTPWRAPDALTTGVTLFAVPKISTAFADVTRKKNRTSDLQIFLMAPTNEEESGCSLHACPNGVPKPKRASFLCNLSRIVNH